VKTVSCVNNNIGLFNHHEKFEKQLHVHRKKASNHISCKDAKAKINHVSHKNANVIHVLQNKQILYVLQIHYI